MLRQLHSAVRRLLLAAAAISLSLASAASAGDVVINEIHYDPADKTVPEEFIELYNRSGSEIDLSGWFFSGGVRYAFPPGAAIAAGGYLVVAEDPATVEALYGSTGVLGPYEGRLENEGELVILRDAEGTIVDQVEYDTSFPWPIDATGEGSSMELIDPALDNGLGSSWRASGWFQAPDAERVHLIPPEAHEWLYRPATSEPSDPPEAWREVDFEEDGSWRTGQAGFGYGDDDDNTLIEDMQGNYTGIYMRKRFEMSAGEIEALPRFLVLGIFVDDGAIFWLNGLELTRYKVAEGPQPFDSLASGSGEARWTNIEIPRPAQFLRAGQNVLAVHAMNRTITSADFSADAALFLPGSEDYESSALARLPTPGSENTVFSRSAPPQILQVGHHPLQPSDDRQIIFTAEAADPDGVEAVSLGVQIVPPGGYIPAWLPLEPATLLSSPLTELAPNPAFEDPASWSSIPMTDDGQGADARAGDGIYTAVLSPQANRTLLRYRITAADTAGNEVTAPFPDDPSLNFACFVYNGVPEYVATRMSVHPEGAGHVWPAELMNSLPVYFIITRNQDLMHCIAYDSSWQIPKSNENARDKFNWECAFVYEGRVHDHVMYRLRQANDRYGGSGKRSMRFRFQKGNWLRARDEWGRLYPTRWRTLNTGKQFDNKRVGNFGLTETLNAILWNLVGAPAPHFHNYHMRVIDAPEEAPSDSYGQYRGDFWGMFSAIEDYDPRFLDAHGLADGNLYKLKDGIFNGNLLRRNQGRYAVTNDSDFQNIRANLRPTQTDAWLDAHVNYERWYPYHAVVEGIRHYDFVPADSHSKNRAWYFEPDYSGSEFGRLWTLPWD
ncbi:MAG: lamin tail domain-containing protein, partial [Planctomycetes bacterium]|nr:lamin tail domain-containing protein [Planctomycetota bacterium]